MPDTYYVIRLSTHWWQPELSTTNTFPEKKSGYNVITSGSASGSLPKSHRFVLGPMQGPPIHQISSISVSNFLRNPADKQTNRQTNKPHRKHNLLGGGNNCPKYYKTDLITVWQLLPRLWTPIHWHL